VAGEDSEGAVDLLSENGARKFMGQGDQAERQDEGGAGAGGGGPAVVGANGEDDGLGTGVAEAAELGGEVLGGELFAAAVEEDENGGGTGGLAVKPGEESCFGVMGLRFAGEIAGGAGEEVGGEGRGGVRLGAGAGGRNGGQDELHVEGVELVMSKFDGNYELLDCDLGNHK